MSFASSIKKEICSLSMGEVCCARAELLGVLTFGAVIGYKSICLSTENATIAKRAYSLFKFLFGFTVPIIRAKQKSKYAYLIQVLDEHQVSVVLDELKLMVNTEEFNNLILFRADEYIIRDQCCKRAFLRGAFAYGGSCIAPNKNYHLEVVTNHYRLCGDLKKCLEFFDVLPKTIIRKSNYVTYLKGGEKISDFLNIIGANNSLLEFENVRIIKDVRNNVNRRVNCESANIDKTISAAFNQIKAIKKIDRIIGLRHLEPALREMAELRLMHSDASLKDLGAMLEKPIGKSGVNHRLRKIEEIARGLEDLK